MAQAVPVQVRFSALLKSFLIGSSFYFWEQKFACASGASCAARSIASGETRLKMLSHFVEALLQTPPYVQVRFSALKKASSFWKLFFCFEVLMIAVFVNCATILLGSFVGLLFAKKIPQKVTDSIQLACGLVSFIMGVQMSFKYQNVVYLALALILGGIVGTLLDIDGKILAFGKFLERVFVKKSVGGILRVGSDPACGGKTCEAGFERVSDQAVLEPLAPASGGVTGDSPVERVATNEVGAQGETSPSKAESFTNGRPQKNFAYAFLNASVLFCVGAMAIVGSFKAGIEKDYSIIFLKSILDGFISIGFAVAMGMGTAFSVIAIFLYQGALTMLSVLIAPYVSEQMISELTGSGGALIILIGVNLMGLKKVKTANYLPAVLFSVIFVLCEPFVKNLLSL